MKKVTVILGFLFLTAGLMAEEAALKAISYEDCVKTALANSFDYKIQSEKLNQANLDRLKAVGGILPEITLNHNRFYDYGSSLSDNGWDTSISATQPVFYGFSKLFTISQMDRTAVKEEWNLAALKKTIAQDTADAFFGLASAQADLLNTREAFDVMTERVKELKQREALGKTRLSELYSTQASAAVLAAQLKQAEAAVEAASDNLASVINADNTVIIQPVDTGAAAPDMDRDKAVNGQPEIKAAIAAIEAESSRINALHSAFLPQVDLSVSRQLGHSGISAPSPANYSLTLMANWPLFEGGARVFEAMKGYSAEESLKQQKLQMLKTVLYDLKAKARNYEASAARVVALKEAYDKSQASYKLQEKDFRYGMATNIEVMQAMADLTNIKTSYDREIITKEKNRALLGIMAENGR